MVAKIILPERTLLVLLFLFFCVLCADGDQTVRLQQVEASDLTLPGITGVQRDALILWFYGPEKAEETIFNSLINNDKDRLQLNRSSGALTIRNISTNDSGFYTLQVITGRTLSRTFSVTVYAPVSVPVIRRKEENESCSPVCCVKNGQDVTLTWYKENEIISNRSITNETHLSVSLNLSAKIQPSCTIRYICVSANPVSNQTASLNIRESCCQKPENSSDKPHGWIPVVASIGLFLLMIFGVMGTWAWRKQKKQDKKDKEIIQDTVNNDELNYAEVNIKTPNGVRVNEKKVCRLTDTDTEDALVYSEVKRSI